MRFSRIGILILAVTSLQACVMGPTYTPMTEEKRNKVNQLELYNLVIQDEVRPAVNASNVSMAMGGGLIGAMIDSSINKKRNNTAQGIIKPLYDATSELDYRKILAESVNVTVNNEFNVDELKEQAETILLSNKALKQKLNALEEGESLLYLSNFYAFVSDSKYLNTSTLAFLYSNDGKAKKSSSSSALPKPTYFNIFNYQSKLVGSGNTNSMEQWSKDNAALFREELNRSITETANFLAYDLQPVPAEEQCVRTVRTLFPSVLNANLKVLGKLVKKEDERALIRSKAGHLYSSVNPLVYIKTKTKKACK